MSIIASLGLQKSIDGKHTIIMFTGLVNEVGSVISIQKKGVITQLRIQNTRGNETDRTGDSICINGVCLTVTALSGHILEFDLSPETITTTTLGGLKTSDRVNIERALQLNDRLGGHLLSGHIDGIGYVREQKKIDKHYLLGVEFPSKISCYLVEKGSIGVDGVSLTISDLEKDLLWVSIIPHTAEVTTLKEKKRGDRVNVEADLLAKYIHRLLAHYPTLQFGEANTTSSREVTALGKKFLAKHGFLS